MPSFRAFIEGSNFQGSKTKVVKVDDGVYAQLRYLVDLKEWRIENLIFDGVKFDNKDKVINWIKEQKDKIRNQLELKIWNKRLRRLLIFYLNNIKLEERK
jgi:hypothetical protein